MSKAVCVITGGGSGSSLKLYSAGSDFSTFFVTVNRTLT